MFKLDKKLDKQYISSLENIMQIGNYMKNTHLKSEVNEFESGTNDELFYRDELFIQRIVRLNRNNIMNDSDMNDHIATILLAGTDTITVSITNIILLLAIHAECQEKCYNEVKDIVNDKEEIDFEMLKKLTYFHMCVKECLRLLPTIPLIGRKTNENLKLGKYYSCYII